MATAGWLAMASPALAILVLLRFIGPLAIAGLATIVMIAKKVDAVARQRGGRGTESRLVAAAALRCNELH